MIKTTTDKVLLKCKNYIVFVLLISYYLKDLFTSHHVRNKLCYYRRIV